MNLSLGEEYPVPSEAQYINQIIADSTAIREKTHTQRLRGQHAKANACVKARFEVLQIADARARHGLFQSPKSYDAVLRFSNGTGRMQSDFVKDGRGLAIKVLGLNGASTDGEAGDSGTQDFVMINFKAFPIRDAKQYAAFMRWRLHLTRLPEWISKPMLPLFFFMTPSRIWQFFTVARHVPQRTGSMAEQVFHSMSPYRLGPSAIKFRVLPECGTQNTPVPDQPDDNYLFQDLRSRLREGEIKFIMKVQFQEDAIRHPVEDASVIWEGSDFVEVARITIAKQDLDTPAAQEESKRIERMSFNPWHTLPEHRPIGGINRLRNAVYQASTNMRRHAEPK